jgi:hypothetical protein
MGYRSTVYIGIQKDQKEEFEQSDEYGECFVLIEETDTHLVYEGEYLKWYSDYKDVKRFNAIVRSNEDNFCVAIGEDNEIHSDIGDWQNHIGLSMKAYIYN